LGLSPAEWVGKKLKGAFERKKKTLGTRGKRKKKREKNVIQDLTRLLILFLLGLFRDG